MKLRYVPDDELAEIQDLLEQHELAYYATSAGNWGISLPALWLVEESELERARTVLEDYGKQRQSSSQALYEAMKASGSQRTVMDIVRENPLRFVLYIAIVFVTGYISLMPFLQVH